MDLDAPSSLGIFSIQKLERNQEKRLRHLLFCRWCEYAMESRNWELHRSTENGDRCPGCSSPDEPLPLTEVHTFRERQKRAHVFVCSSCGEPYAVPVVPDPTPESVHPGDEAAIRALRARRYEDPWSVPCRPCGKSTPPVRATEYIGRR